MMRTVRAIIGATAAGGIALSLALAAGQATAGPRGPQAIATPSTGLENGQTVSVTSTGWSAGQSLLATECATLPTSAGVPGNTVCDARTGLVLTADATGTVTFKHVAATSFVGYAPPGRDPWGTVDCYRYPCSIGVADEALSAMAIAPISFK
jgi:hypothetical protein